jgi:PAS domain S-box-containing protein
MGRQSVGASPLRLVHYWTARVQGLARSTRYVIAVAAAVVGVLLRLTLDPVWEGQLPYITLFPAIMVSAWMGGLGPGLLTTFLAGLGAAYFWVPTLRSPWISAPGEWLGLAVFVAVGTVISGLNEMWRRGTVALADSEQRLAVTLASIGDAVLTTDENGIVLTMNEVAERLTGWPAAEALGRPVEDVLVLVGETPASIGPNPVRQALRDGTVTSLDGHTLLVSRNGDRIPIDDSAAPIRLEDRTGGVVLVFRDIRERRRLEAERASQDRIARELAAIVETSDDAIVSKDLQSTIRSWNRGAERIFGYTAEEMIGRSIRTIIPEERWSEEDEVLGQLRQGHRVDHFETIRRRKDGSEVPVSLTISPIYSAAGVVVGASKIARDITERRQAEAERAQLLEREQMARAEIERASRLKDDFVAVLSHELRTPLNAVMGYTQLLTSGALEGDAVAHAYQAIQRNAQAQARLVESLLDLSRILAGKLELNSEVLDLSAVVALAVDAVRPEALKKHISLDVREAPGIRVFGDSARLQQVFWNLLSNAVKFTAAGGRVAVHLVVDGADVNVRVEDNGRGIPASLLPFVFDRFKQGEGERGRSQTGLGLGLALVREMLHAHQGAVTAQSAGEGLGSTFTVRLPLLLPRETASSDVVQTIHQQRPDLRQLQPDVLIVDDEPDARHMLVLMLETRGARVRQAGSAIEAFDSMLDKRPDILLADLGMSGEDGYSLIRRWRSQEAGAAGARVAAIAVTASAGPADRDMTHAAGFDWHMAKPVDGDELVRVIEALLPGNQRLNAQKAGLDRLGASAEPAPP